MTPSWSIFGCRQLVSFGLPLTILVLEATLTGHACSPRRPATDGLEGPSDTTSTDDRINFQA
jgi:hypothetical protein